MSAGGEASFRQLRVVVPFLLVVLIWGSTWIVIKDQLGTVPPTWSVAYRFANAGAAMFVFAAASGATLRIGWKGHVLAATFGVPQFFFNFNFVYSAELYVTSGLVAVVFALLMVPNSALAWLFLKHKATPRFVLGSAIACIGVGMLFVQEVQASPISPAAAMTGIGLALLGVLSASTANVMQASARLKARPVASLLAWGMTYGVIANAAFAFARFGPPVVESRPGYWIGLLYLGVVASAAAFTLYFGLVRAIGPAKAAYTSLVIPIIAMAISTVAEGYRWSLLAAAGGAVALAGMAIALSAGRTAAPPADPPTG